MHIRRRRKRSCSGRSLHPPAWRRRFGRPNAFWSGRWRLTAKNFEWGLKKDALEPNRSELQGSPSVLFPECCVGLEHWLQPSLPSLLVDLFCRCHSSMKKRNRNGKFPDLMPHTVQVSPPKERSQLPAWKGYEEVCSFLLLFFCCVTSCSQSNEKSENYSVMRLHLSPVFDEWRHQEWSSVSNLFGSSVNGNQSDPKENDSAQMQVWLPRKLTFHKC